MRIERGGVNMCVGKPRERNSPYSAAEGEPCGTVQKISCDFHLARPGPQDPTLDLSESGQLVPVAHVELAYESREVGD